MAENLDMPPMGNFSIQDTMDGIGNPELLNDLFGSETATGNPDDIKDIKDDPAPDPAPAKKTTSKQTAATDPEPEKKDENPVKDIQSFLYGEDDEEEADEDDEEAKPAPAKKAPAQNADNQEDSDDENDEEGEDTPTSQFTALSNDLFKLGVFSKDEDEEDVTIDSPEAFLERFQTEKKKGAIEIVDNFIGQFGEDYQQAFDAIFVKGVNPKDYFNSYNQIQTFSEMDLTDEGNQVAVIKQALADQGFEKEDIDTEVERIKNYGDLENVATKHHKILVKKEAAKLQELEQTKQAQLQQQQAIKQQYLQNVNNVLQEKIKAKEFDGIPINPKLAGELQDFLVTDKYKTASGETLTDFDRTILELKRPENHATKVKLVFLSQLIQEWFVQSLRRTTSLSEVQGPKATALRKASKLCSRPLLRSRPVV